MRNRWLDSSFGRWLSRDPAGYVDGLNLYQYVQSNPFKYYDPFGLFQCGAAIRQNQLDRDLLNGAITEKEYRDIQRARGVGGLLGASLVLPGPEDFLLGLAVKGLLKGGSKAATGAARLLAKGSDDAADAAKVARAANQASVQRLEAALDSGDPRQLLKAVQDFNKPSTGGRLGSTQTREQVRQIAGELKNRNFVITGGGGGKEEFIGSPGPGLQGSAFPDITAMKNGRTLRINTVDTLKNGVTPTARERRAAAKIRALRPNDHLLLIPKVKNP